MIYIAKITHGEINKIKNSHNYYHQKGECDFYEYDLSNCTYHLEIGDIIYLLDEESKNLKYKTIVTEVKETSVILLLSIYISSQSVFDVRSKIATVDEDVESFLKEKIDRLSGNGYSLSAIQYLKENNI